MFLFLKKKKKNRNEFSYDFGCENDHSTFIVNSSVIIISQMYGSSVNYGDFFGITFDKDPNTGDYFNFSVINGGSTLTTSLSSVYGGCGLIREDSSSGALISYWILVGGYNTGGTGYSNNLQIYDGISWNSTTMPYYVAYQACMITNDNQYLFQFGGSLATNYISYVDLDTLVWTDLGGMLSQPRDRFSLAYVPPVSVYLIAGYYSGALTNVELFNIQISTSQSDSNLNNASYHHSTRIFSNLIENYEISKIYVIGGIFAYGRVEESNIISNSTFNVSLGNGTGTAVPTKLPSQLPTETFSKVPTAATQNLTIPVATDGEDVGIYEYIDNEYSTDYSNYSIDIQVLFFVNDVFDEYDYNINLITEVWESTSNEFGIILFKR